MRGSPAPGSPALTARGRAHATASRRIRIPQRAVIGDHGGMSTLARPRDRRVIAGVCAALADRFGLTPTTVRVLAVLLVLVAGLSLWAYVLLWIIIPNED